MNRLEIEILEELRENYECDEDRAEAIYALCKEAFSSDLRDEIRDEAMMQIKAEAMNSIPKESNVLTADMIRRSVATLKQPALFNPDAPVSGSQIVAYMKPLEEQNLDRFELLRLTVTRFASFRSYNIITEHHTGRLSLPMAQVKVNCNRCLKQSAYALNIERDIRDLAISILLDNACC